MLTNLNMIFGVILSTLLAVCIALESLTIYRSVTATFWNLKCNNRACYYSRMYRTGSPTVYRLVTSTFWCLKCNNKACYYSRTCSAGKSHHIQISDGYFLVP